MGDKGAIGMGLQQFLGEGGRLIYAEAVWLFKATIRQSINLQQAIECQTHCR